MSARTTRAFGKNSSVRSLARALLDLLAERPALEHAMIIDAALMHLRRQKLSQAIPHFARIVLEEGKKRDKGLSASVTSAYTLPEKMKHMLRSGLQDALKQEVALQEHTAKELLGGLTLVLGDERLDGSLRGALGDLRIHLVHA